MTEFSDERREHCRRSVGVTPPRAVLERQIRVCRAPSVTLPREVFEHGGVTPTRRPRDRGEEPTAGGKYDPAATTGNRDKYYRSLYAVVEASLGAAGGALAGDGFWAWGGEARPPSKWTGDPPHETPGWFSVYDMDASTTAIISAHAGVVRR
jgi:hypothetical protein